MSVNGQLSQTMLIAMDGSPAARAAATTSIQIARGLSLAVHGLYVVDSALVLDPYGDYRTELGWSKEPMSRAQLVDWFVERGNRALQWLVERCRAAGVPIAIDTWFGGTSNMIVREATQARLLVLGRQGHRYATDPTHLGHHFHAVAHHAHMPLLVGGRIAQRRLQRLLLAYDDSQREEVALKWAARLQRAFSAEVIVVTVAENNQDNQPQSTQIRNHLGHSHLADYRLLMRSGQPADHIVAAAAQTSADLIVMGGYHHNALLAWLLGSTLDGVLRHTQLPVLVV